MTLLLALLLQADDGAVIPEPRRTLEEVEKAGEGMPPLAYEPPAGRGARLRRTWKRLGEGRPLRIVMLGDSIVNDARRSGWVRLLKRSRPGCRIERATSVRGSGLALDGLKRDPIHANARGEQVLGRILFRHVSPAE